jgi:hypothetical protein
MGNIDASGIIGALLATLSGAVVALFTGYLAAGREAARERRLLANARALLALEVRSNRDALTAFWHTVTVLGASQSEGEHAATGITWAGQAAGSPVPIADPVDQLAAMYAGGLATYSLPAWSTTRWHGIEPRTVAALSADEVIALDRLYRALREISDLYSRIATITPSDWSDLQKNVGGRFWNRDLARDRTPLFARLGAAVAYACDAPDPLPGAFITDR